MIYSIYILSNKTNTTVYIGFTNDLQRRILEHRQGQGNGFTKRYHVYKLVYFEEYSNVNDAIAREKQLKHWRREKKNSLIESFNPEWKDLFEDFS
ncbi:MAG: GIY-YIG nuclease family protein [Clostridia bacterium]|nr:GIY-YIG nuclease family protein [Clostridia bacterium]